LANNNQLWIKEKELIQGCIKGDSSAEKEFDYLFRPKIFNIAKGFTKTDNAKAEDLTQDILIKLFNLMKKHEIKKNLNSWVEKIEKNYCIDEDRKEHSKKSPKFVPPKLDDNNSTNPVEVSKDPSAIAPGSKEYHKSPGMDETLFSNIEIEYKRNIPLTIQKSLELSLENIELFYNLRKRIRSDLNNKYERIINIYNILSDTKKKITYILGPVSWEKICRYKSLKESCREELSDLEKKEFNKLKKQSFKIKVHEDLNELTSEVSAMLFHSPLFNPMAIVENTPYDSPRYFGILLSNLADILPTIKIKPPRLMYSIWIKEKGLRKGKYADLKKIKLIFRYFKKTTKGTEKEFLFDSIDEDLSTFESIRKSMYKKSSKEKLCKKLVDFIYKASFRLDH